MQDRTPIYPGRVKLAPVAGQENVYDMTREDSPTQPGTPLSKDTFLKDSTAALYGLGTDAVPDDAFAFIGKYNQHWWKRRTRVVTSDQGSSETIYLTKTSGSGGSSSSTSINYSSGFVVNGKLGVAELVKPILGTASVSYSNSSNANVLVGNYFELAGKIYYCDSFIGAEVEESTYYTTKAKASLVSVTITFGEWEYIYGTDKSEYPSGITDYIDGYEYVYLGIPFDNVVNGIRMETGTYVGNGMYDSGNPNSLTFSFTPKIVIVNHPKYQIIFGNSYDSDTHSFGVFFDALGENYSTISVSRKYYYHVKKSGNTISWYTTENASVQLNSSGSTYHYIAIG